MSAGAEATALRDLMLVGSVPLETVDDVFQACGTTIGEWLSFMPDGEVGDRAAWTVYLHTHVFSKCMDLERVSAPAVDNQESPPEHRHQWDASLVDPGEFDLYRIRDGVDVPRFGDMYFGGVAADSYRRFAELRADGAIPQHVRFQVCVPGTTSAVEEHFVDPAQWPRARTAYRDAVAAELQRLLDVVPAEHLAIQFDLAWEVVDLSLGDAPTFPWSAQRTWSEKFSTHVDGATQLLATVPDDVVVGLHWCYGTWGGWPMNELRDMRLCTDLTLAVLEGSVRRVDYAHLPVAENADDAFFEALDDLAAAPCKSYLGLIHHSDGIEGFRRRWDLVRRRLPSAGIASVCGFGRLDPSLVPQLLALHRQCALEVQATAGRAPDQRP